MKKLLLTVAFILLILSNCFSQNILSKIESLINKGEFTKAKTLITNSIIKDVKLSPIDRIKLDFELERMERIKLDFKKDEKDILKSINRYIPKIKSSDQKQWEKEKSLECIMIDKKKKYFNYAAQNLFRINKECIQIKKDADSKSTSQKPEFVLVDRLKEIIDESKNSNSKKVKPITYQVDYTVTLDSNVVPEGEIIRCWLPFPKEITDRQGNIKLLSTSPEKYILADNSTDHRSIYFEQRSFANKKAEFSISYQFECYANYNKIDPEKIRPNDKSSAEYKNFTSERYPHIVFTPQLKELSKKIVGTETNPYLIAKKIFQWVDENIPWASAREYSAIYNIPMYAIENKHGDCGIQTLLFMTLCRINGIPTKWESGWEITTMHDWSQMYLEPYGWVLVDQSYGLQRSENEDIKWYYLGSFENRRLVVNSDFSGDFYPAKIHHRSETVDFQRGELEWRGGNIYFDKWDYTYKIKEIK